MNEKSTASTQGISRLFTVVETMASIGKPARLQDIAHKSNASPSTVMRILNAMIECGYAVQDPETQFYSLSFKFLQIGNSIRENTTINSLIHPYLYKATSETGSSSALSVMNDKKITYIDEVVSLSNMIRVHHHLGIPFPLYNTAAGKLFLSEMTKAELDDYFKTEELIQLTPTTLTKRADIEKEIKDIRRMGYAYNDEESALGLRCLAFPIYDDTGALLAAFSISGTIYAINEDTKEGLVETVSAIIKEFMETCGPMLTAYNRSDLF